MQNIRLQKKRLEEDSSCATHKSSYKFNYPDGNVFILDMCSTPRGRAVAASNISLVFPIMTTIHLQMEGNHHARIICEVAMGQSFRDLTNKCHLWLKEQYELKTRQVTRNTQGHFDRAMTTVLWRQGVQFQEWEFGTKQKVTITPLVYFKITPSNDEISKLSYWSELGGINFDEAIEKLAELEKKEELFKVDYTSLEEISQVAPEPGVESKPEEVLQQKPTSGENNVINESDNLTNMATGFRSIGLEEPLSLPSPTSSLTFRLSTGGQKYCTLLFFQ
ncbi:9760_t:CDS:2 [Funneliformis caledonium]|uniref:9760_t:CDS:1 n=1 Tax=Funneliformis caledonium TaxID=1117310 RepID=A0A9N9GMN1_9GLOM|nr:9760_t:CDS:2 [Funneliformis caledonium]